MSDVPAAIKAAYDPERFRADGHRLIDALADQLAAWHAREGAAIPWRDPHEARAAWAAELYASGDEGGEVAGGADLVADLTRIAASSTALHHPRTMGHQVPPPLPGAALAELTAALLNNGMAVYEMGPASTPIELAVIDWMCRKIGFAPDGAGGGATADGRVTTGAPNGVLTSGGSVGNLTALLAMRQAKAGYDAWSGGAHAGPPLAVIVSSDAHYSIDRALRVMGWGDGAAIRADLDSAHRMTAASVEAALAKAHASGSRRVIGIVAAAGSTATGAFDPLDELADVAAKHGLWLHVDAAHGGSVSLSATQRAKLKGIERADSVVWDLHKLLVMPALVTAVLFRHGGHTWEAFAQRASYLFADAKPSEKWRDLGTRTLECTKRAMAIEMWTALRVHGEQWFGAVVDRQVELARELAALVATAPDFELALAPESNIVCFRHLPDGVPRDARDVLDRHNRSLRQRVVEDGTFYIVGTQLPGGFYLRSTLMNPLTETSDLAALLDHIRALAR